MKFPLGPLRRCVAAAVVGPLAVATASVALTGCIGTGDDSVVQPPAADAGSADASHDGSSPSSDATTHEGGTADATATQSGGDGGPPVASFGTGAIDFGFVPCGGAAVTKTLGISNTGSSTLSVSVSAVGSDFSISPSSLTVGAGATGTFTISASVPSSATAGVAASGSLSIFTNDPTHANASLLLSATPSGATLTGTSQYTFASTEVGVEASPLQLQLTNSGNASATFVIGVPSNPSITISGVDGGEGTLLAPNATLGPTASFLPTALAPAAGITANSTITALGTTCGVSLTSISLLGTTAAGSLSGWPSNNTVDFGPAFCGGVAPAPQTITLTNSGAVPVRVTGVQTTGGFTTNLTPGTQIGASGGTLAIVLTAPPVPAPSSAVPVVSLNRMTGTLVLQTDADTSSAGTSLTLTEEPQGAVLAFGTPTTAGCTTSPNFGDFSTPPVVLLESSAPQNFCVTNAGNAPANVTLSATEETSTAADGAGAAGDASSDAATSGPDPFLLTLPEFTISAMTSSSTPAVEQESLTFTPAHASQTAGSLSMAVDSTTVLCELLPAPLPLSGDALGGGPTVTPTLVTLPATCGGAAPASQTFVVSNSGTADFTWTMTGPTGPGAGQYTVTADPPPGVLSPTSSSTVTVTALAVPSPAPDPNPAALQAQVIITTDVPYDPTHVVTLSEVPIGDQISVSTGSLRFGEVPLRTVLNQSFMVSNNANPGSADANVALTLSETGTVEYTQPEQTGGSLAPGSTETEQVTFTAQSTMAQPATITLHTSDPLCTPLPVPISVSGTGTAGSISLSASTLTFGQPGDPKGLVNCGSTGIAQTLTISNLGNQAFNVTGLSFAKGSSSPFALSGPGAAMPSVPIAGSTSLTITPAPIPSVADPNDPSAFSDVLTINTDNAGQANVALVMQAQGAVIANTPLPTTWTFGTVGAGSIGTFTTTIQNTGNAPATVSLTRLSLPSIFGLQINPTTVQAQSVTELVGNFTPPLANGSWSDQGQLNVTTSTAFCASLPSQWVAPTIALSGASNSTPQVTIAGSLVFPTTDCGGAPPGGQSVTLTNATNQPYAYSVRFGSGKFYTFADSGSGTLHASGISTIVVNPQAVSPGQGVHSGSAPYADDLIIDVTTAPTPTTFTVPISWTLNGAVLSLAQGAGPFSNAQGSFYVADGTSDFPLTMNNSGTASATVSWTTVPSGPFSIVPASPISVLPNIPALTTLVSAPSAPGCPTTSNATVTFAYSGPICQPFAQESVNVDACSGTYTPLGVSPRGDAGTGADAATPDAASTAGADATVALTACTESGQTNCVTCSGNTGGICTATEAIFVQLDVSSGFVTAPGPDSFTAANLGCYGCLVANDCLDSVVNHNGTGLECDDLSGNFTNGSGQSVGKASACLGVVACVAGPTGAGCGANADGLNFCYCGTGGGPSTTCVSSGTKVDGACLSSEANGFTFAQSDATDILSSFGSRSQPSGVANDIFSCALANGCTTCVQ